MRAHRFFFFLLVIALGVGLGVAYGWVVSPPDYANLKPETLRYDYKADYVLMIAEVYRKDSNLASAIRRLALLENQPPERLVAQALLSARDLAYSQPDLETLAFLARALQGGAAHPTDTPSGDMQPDVTPSPEKTP